LSSFKISYITKDASLISEIENFILDWKSDSPTMATKTSGSTGKPKAMLLDKSKMRNSALMSGKYFDFQPFEKVVLALSPTSIGGKMLIIRAILHQMELIVIDPQRNPLKEIDFPIAFISLVPMQLLTVLNENPEKLNLVHNLLLGGAPVSNDLENKMNGLSCQFFESFGMTETMSHIAIRKLGMAKTQPFEGLEQITFSVCEEGNLIIHAPLLGLNTLATNDHVELIDNKHFHWLGRTDFAINSGGFKFHPELIERKISHLIENRFFISGEKDELLGERIILIMEGNKADTAALLEEIKTKVTLYEAPKEIYWVQRFSETNSGKINRIETFKNRS
jgi:O-succinylbenzoic acid--CoA ligase